MEQITKKVLKTLLAFVMCFSVLHIPYMGTRVAAEDGDDVIEEVTDEIVEIVQPTVYQAVLDEVTVVATVAEGTFDDEVDLVVEPISKGSAEYQKADETLKNSGADYDGMLAFDIFFKVVGTEEKIEPDGSVDVQLSLNSAALAEIAPQIDVDSVNVTHITEAEEVEVVADVFDETAGTVEVKKVGEEVQKLNANFSVSDFSTFTITWTETNEETHEEEEKTATVVWGEIGTGGTITPFDVQNVSIDTSAGSVSLANIFDGYEFAQAHYEHGETNVVVDPVLVNDNGVYKLNMHFNDPDHQSVELTAIEDGSTIYVGYVPKGEPHDPSPESVDGPTTIKNVVDNHDGTQSIILDVKGAVKTETTVTGANVLIVLDRTKSMRYNMGNDQIAQDEANNRWTVARAAIDLLVTTLSTGDNAGNDVEYSLISFYNRIDSPIHTWGTDEWTSNATTYNAYIQGDTLEPIGANDNTNNGTNWEDPLYRALRVAQAKNTAENNKDKTYVIFVTDGSPNARGTGEAGNGYTGYVRNGQTAAVNAARPHAVSLYSDSNIEFYGVFCGASAGGYDTLDGMLTAAAATAGKTDRPATIDGADSDAIHAAFANIASTIIKNFGASDTTVDDGVTSLSNVSAMVSGEAGGFEYYKTNQYDEQGKPINFSTWENPAGASYSEDNGVTWDLSSVGVLEDQVTYRLVFKVWPSQEAYDLIADLNNEVKKIADVTAEQKPQLKVVVNGNTYTFTEGEGKGWSADGSTYLPDAQLQTAIDSATSVAYYLKTNTHLQTTYTYNGQTYTDAGITQSEGQMLLESETMNIRKDWVDDINTRNRANKVEFYLKVGDKYYMDGEDKYVLIVKDKKLLSAESASDADGQKPAEYFVTNKLEWIEEVEIAPGIVQFDANGNATVLETGHSYQLEEGKSWTYEFNKTENEGGTFYTVVEGSEEEASGYSMEFQSEVVRPMVLTDTAMGGSYSGTLVYLVEADSVFDESRLLNSNVYTIDGVKYRVLADETHTTNASVTGFNFKTAELDITKIIDSSLSNKTAAELDAETFTYDITITVPAEAVNEVSGINYWIYTPATEGDTWTLPEYSGTNPGAPFAPTGYAADETWGGTKYSTSADGTTVTATVTINRNQVIRLTNLPTGSTYKIVEEQANGKDLTSQGYLVTNTSTNGTASKTTVDNDTITGTITDPNTRFYNRFSNKLDAVDAEIKVTKVIDGREWTAADSFTLTLVAAATTNPMTDTTEVTATTEAKTNTYGQLRFTAAGEYTYTITETNGGSVVGDLTYAENPVATIVVTIAKDVDGKLYVSNITGGTFTAASEGKVATVEATVTNTFVKTKVTVTKVWTGVDEEDIPESIAMLLKANGVEAGNATLTAENEWTYTWTGLQAYEDGEAIEYTVEEPNVPTGYTVSGGTISGNVTDGYQVTFTNTRDTAQLKLTKVVVGDVEVPATTTFTVTGPKEFGTVTLTYADLENGVKDFGEVPTGDYSVTETGAGIEGYTLVTTYSPETGKLTLAKGDEGELTVTNTYTRDTAKLVLEKVVNGDPDVPSTAKFTVHGPSDFGTEGVMEIAYSQLKDNKYDFGEVPTGDYYVEEEGADVDGFTLVTTIDYDSADNALTLEKGDEGKLTVTNTYTRNVYDVTVKKTFNIDDLSKIPSNFAIGITIGEVAKDDLVLSGASAVDGEGTRTYTWTLKDVPYESVVAYEEKNYEISGFEWSGSEVTGSIKVSYDSTKNVIEVTNSYTREDYGVKVIKHFDIDNVDNIPDTFKISIKVDGTAKDDLTLSNGTASDGGKTYTWILDDVPYESVVAWEESGYEIDGFEWTETTTSGTLTVSATADNVIEVTNKYTRNTYDVTVKKTFKIDELSMIPTNFAIGITIDDVAKDDLVLNGATATDGNGTRTYTWTLKDVPYESVVAYEEKNYQITGFEWSGSEVTGSIKVSYDSTKNVIEVENTYDRNEYDVTVSKTFEIDDLEKIPEDFVIDITIGTNTDSLALEDAEATEAAGKKTFTWTLEDVPYNTLIGWEEKNYEIDGFTWVAVETTGSLTVSATEGANVIEVTNKYTRNEYNLKVTKIFNIDDPTKIPENFQITLLIVEEIIPLKLTDEDVEVSEDKKTYTWIIEKVPYETVVEWAEDGYEIEGFTWTGTAKDGEITISADTDDNILTVTNPYTRNNYELTVTKVFNIDDLDKISEGFEIDLTYGETTVVLKLDDEGVEVTENNTTYTWKVAGIPYETVVAWEEKGYEIEGFTWTGTAKDGEITISADTDDNILTVTNPYTRNNYELTVTKVFTGITAEMIPEDFQISITVDGEEIQVLKVTDEDVVVDGLKYTWKLDEKIPYETEITAKESGTEIFGATLAEDAVTEVTLVVDVEDNVMALTNPYTIDTFEVVVTKEWDDNNDQDGFRAKLGATVQLYKQLAGENEKTKVGDPVTVGTGDDWSNTWKDLPAYENGKLVTYSVEETYADEKLNYEKTIGDPVKYTGEVSETIAIKNTHEPEKVDVPVTKEWAGDEDFTEYRPEKIVVELFADGKSIGEEGMTAELTAENEWTYTFEGLDKYADGKEIEYTVDETEIINGYVKKIEESDEGGYVIINTFEPIHFDPPVMKTVKGDDVPEDTFKFQFEGLNGAPMPEGAEGQIMTCELKAGEEHEFGDVYLVEPGTYEYKITEINDGKEGYAYDAKEYLLKFVITQAEDGTLSCDLTINDEKADYKNLKPSQFEFVNEYREYIDIEVVKVWDDNDDAEGKRPDEIEVTLYANDEAVETVVLNEENNWSYKWVSFEYSDENFEEIQYTVKEDKVPEGYSMSHQQDGYKITITNSINPPETGDSNNVKLWATLLALSMTNSVALAGVALKKRKEEEE